MKAKIRDSKALSAIRPLDLAAYLRARGWHERERTPGRSAVWTREQGEDLFEVLLPLDTVFRDYPARIADLLDTLERAENRSQLEVAADIETASADRVRIRASTGRHHDGSIGLGEGVELVSRARDLMLAAACATIEPRSHYPTRVPDQALRYLNGLELGQTERGSFVLTILSPVPPALQTTLFPPADDPFERQVTRALARAFTAARLAAEESVTTGELEPFRRAVVHGVSANFCDSLTGLLDASGGEQMELSIGWASSRGPVDGLGSAAVLTRDLAQVLREASRLFKETEPEPSFELRGYVIALRRDEGRGAGEVIVSGLLEGSIRKIKIVLDSTAYARAIEAHRSERPVACEGTLVRTGRSFELVEPRRFEVAAGE
ncbi:MAG: hypothetical protein HC897_13715 [Thermoanaerobaculia bacterium]|nr:hypothetical protein [Thermoanaerobaculia bacterium]